MKGKTLIVYYSQTGQTRQPAEYLQQKINADICEVVPVRSYDEDMWKAAAEAMVELKSGHLPELKNVLPDLSAYDLILIGGPVWGYALSNPILSFMRKVDFSGKKVSAFWTFPDNDENYNSAMKKEAKGATVIDGLSLPKSLTDNKEKAEAAIDEWISMLG